VVKILLALLTDAKDTADAKKGNNPLLDKIIAQGGGPVLGLSLQRYRYWIF
jgi:SecD/SecF fusion protein